MNKIDKAVEDLNEYLDTFYTDAEGWMELADIHSSCHQSVFFHLPPFEKLGNLPVIARYTYALQALSHALLLSPQNPFTFLQFAETAYSSGDVPLALKMFLVVIDMSEEEADAIPLGISIRAWWGIKLVRSVDP
jgi:tetratricopeptide (TPR) repeat protein